MARLYLVLIKLWGKIMDFVIFPQSFIVLNDFIFRQIDEKSLDLAENIIIYITVKQFIILFYAAKSRLKFVQNSCMICM